MIAVRRLWSSLWPVYRVQSLSDLAEARKKKKKRQGSPKTPLALHLILHLLHHHQQVLLELLEPLVLLGRLNHHLPLHLHPTLKVSCGSLSTEKPNCYTETCLVFPTHLICSVPRTNWAPALKSTYTPPPENSLLAQIRDMATFMDCASPVPNGRMPQTSHRSSGRCNPKWFQRQRFYIDRHTTEGDPRAVRTHMRILSVVRIEVFPMYGYNYMKKIVLRRVDLKEYVISERDFKYLYPSDFEDLYLLNLQGHLNHLSPEDKKILTTAVNLWTRNLVIRQRVEDFQLGIESYQTQLNLTKPRWDAKGFQYKHDFIIDEALDYRVKEFRVNRRNPGLDTQFWTKKDVDRSKEFMFAIQKRLKTRRIFQNLENFVGGRIREGLHKDGDADASFHFRNSDKYYHDPEECEYAGPKVTTSHEGNIPQQG
ncbi:hypothetical protein Tco_1491027 [Tanacetum coccineum]